MIIFLLNDSALCPVTWLVTDSYNLSEHRSQFIRLYWITSLPPPRHVRSHFDSCFNFKISASHVSHVYAWLWSKNSTGIYPPFPQRYFLVAEEEHFGVIYNRMDWALTKCQVYTPHLTNIISLKSLIFPIR